METKKKILINLTLLIFIIIGMAIIFTNVVEGLTDKDIANKAFSNPTDFLSYDYRRTTTVDLYIGNGYQDATIWKSTAACFDPDHTADGNYGASYRLQAIVDIDNKYNTNLSDWTGLNVYVPSGAYYGTTGAQRITNSDVVKRGRFLAGIANWMLHGNSGIQDANSSSQSVIDGWYSTNFFVFCNYAKNYNSVFNIMAGSKYTEDKYTGRVSGWKGQKWQRIYGYKGNTQYDYTSVYEEARRYAEDRVNGVGGIKNTSTGDPDIEYTNTETILGPYKIKKTGSAKVTGVTVQTATKTYTTSNIAILDSSKKAIGMDKIANDTNFYIKIRDIAENIKSIKLTGTGNSVHATRIMLFAGGANQRIAVFNTKDVPGSTEITLKVPPARPVIVKYKYIKSIQRKQKDGSYKRIFTVNEVPTITVNNKGKNNASVKNVTYPDYRKYCDASELNSNGVPYVYNGDIVEYQWAIYNIGPGSSSPGTKVTLVDEPGTGLKIQDGKSNGWTKSGNNYTKTITLSSSLKGFKGSQAMQYYIGSNTMIYFEIVSTDKINASGDKSTISNNGIPVALTFKIAGRVFLDKIAQKDGTEDGIISTGDEMLPGIEVVLFDSSGRQVAQKNTDKNGYYEFDKLDPDKSYYVRFKYNGQLYEPTTYQTQKKYAGNGNNKISTTIAERSYATDGTTNRKNFNEKIDKEFAKHVYPNRNDVNNDLFTIYAYTGSNGVQDLLLYNVGNTIEQLQNVNFGIKAREQFDMNLRKDLVKVDVSINGKSHTYDYNGAGEDLEVTIRGTDIPDYERKLRKADLQYKSEARYDSDPDKLQVYVTYKIQIKNQSIGKITGYITDLNDYADTSYQLVNSYDENGKAINWSSSGSVSGNGKTYNKIHTTSIANEGITDKKWIFMQYKVSYDTLRELLLKGETLEENYAEIAGYRNTYTSDRYDLNGNKITNAGAVAGLLDIDSTPDNMNPTSANVQNFVKQSKTDAYQNLSGEEKTKRSTAVFEDDADAAPGLRLIRDDIARTISGTVFEDIPLQEKLKNNERIGDGQYTSGENIVNKVKVELLCQNNADVDTLNKVETRSNTDGSYTLSGYIPGDYLIKFTYGDYECLVNPQQNNQMYTGQDYKSTIYTEGNYKDLYWYNNTSPRNNDAVDDYDNRRQVVNSYSKDYKYDIAKVLNATRTNNSDLLATLAEKTYMTANTAKMAMEIEYLKNEKTAYKVQNIDFGIIERPRTKIVLDKRVSHIKLTATDGTTIFDTNQSTSNLTWKENKYNDRGNMVSTGLVQGTVDENLLYGSSLNVRYTLEIRNHSEVDYNEKSYYVTGVVKDRSKMNRIEPTSVIEYVPNVLQYDAELTKDNGEVYIEISNQNGSASRLDSIAGSNNLWQVLASKKENKNFPDSYRDTLIEAGAFDEAKQTMDEILITNLDGVRNALARNDVISLRNVLTLTRVIARTEDTSNTDEIQNIAEVIRLTIDNGRRPYYEDTTNKEVVEIPGNTYPSTLKNIEEVDTGRAEVLTFVVPFGANRQLTLIVIAIVSLGVLVAGIVVIKKKVL